MDPKILTTTLTEKALQLGFDVTGVTSADPPKETAYLQPWLDLGCAGAMRFFAERLKAYRDANMVLEGVKSILALGMNYRTVEPVKPRAGQGRVSRYAWGIDYHLHIRERLRQLVELHEKLVPTGRAIAAVDTAPIMEKPLAARAGLGWIGKNTLLINRKFGSWIFFAALLTTEELESSSFREPLPPDIAESDFGGKHPCQNCRACIDACPTGALLAPYQLDARKCVSYLTVENRGEIPADIRKKIGDRLFGCDACQEACPWNRQTPLTVEQAFYPREGMNPVELAELDNLDEEAFRHRFRGSPILRAKREGMLRNAATVRENEKTS